MNVAIDKGRGMNSTDWDCHTFFIMDKGAAYITMFKKLATPPRISLADALAFADTKIKAKIPIITRNAIDPKNFFRNISNSKKCAVFEGNNKNMTQNNS